MPLARRALKNFDDLNLPLSYNVAEDDNVLRDCSNVFSNQGKLEKRFGTSLFIDHDFGGIVQSMSYSKHSNGTFCVFAKVGAELIGIKGTSISSKIAGLSTSTKHRGIQWNDKHILLLDTDGFYECDGISFGPVGAQVPSEPTVVLAAGGSLSDSTWTAKLTFYSSTEAFETNASTAPAVVTTSPPNKSFTVGAIPTTSPDVFIDKVRVYVSKSGGPFYYAKEITLGTASTVITTDPVSTTVPPTKNAPPLAGGGKYPTIWRDRFVYAGNSLYPNDVFFSEPDLHDAFDDTASALKLYAKGDGVITGLATGFFNNSVMDPYLVVFKERCTWVYSDINSEGRFTMIDGNVGCVNHDTICVRNGDVYFQSDKGWHIISDGKMIKNTEAKTLSLSAQLDDMFSSPSFDRYVNKSQSSTFHSAYYPTLDQYITFISQSGSTLKTRAYVYEAASSKGFKIYDFPYSVESSCLAQDSDNNPVILLGTNGYIYKHSVNETKDDINYLGVESAIASFALFTWSKEWDWDASFNYREIIIRGLAETISTVQVRGMTNFVGADYSSFDVSFSPNSENVFILDISALDIGAFGEGRINCSAHGDINRVGESLSIGFYQNELKSDMILTGFQIHYSKNGNRN